MRPVASVTQDKIAQDADDQCVNLVAFVFGVLDRDRELAGDAERRNGHDGRKGFEQCGVLIRHRFDAIVEIVQLTAFRETPALSARELQPIVFAMQAALQAAPLNREAFMFGVAGQPSLAGLCGRIGSARGARNEWRDSSAQN